MGIDLRRDLSRDDLENFLAKFDEEAFEGLVNLIVDAIALYYSQPVSICFLSSKISGQKLD